MEISNQKRSKLIKQTFNYTGIFIVLAILFFLWLKKDTLLWITIGIFAVFVGFSMFANLCQVYFSTNNGKVVIRYYQIISFLKKEYQSIEFTHQSLVTYRIEKAMGFADLFIVIKTNRGVAEYPSISLAALTNAEIDQINTTLFEILSKNGIKFKVLD